MGNWAVKRKHDVYWKMAKKENYRSRAAYKLMMILERFPVMSEYSSVLDLGSAPGGWLQVVSEIVGDRAVVVGIDIRKMEPIDNVIFIRGDIKESNTERMLEKVLAEKNIPGFDLILSDMSPSISGVWSLDHARSVDLVESAHKIGMKYLLKNGSIVTKLFQGDLEDTLIDKFKKNFEKIYRFKPRASRSESSEIYIISFKKL